MLSEEAALRHTSSAPVAATSRPAATARPAADDRVASRLSPTPAMARKPATCRSAAWPWPTRSEKATPLASSPATSAAGATSGSSLRQAGPAVTGSRVR